MMKQITVCVLFCTFMKITFGQNEYKSCQKIEAVQVAIKSLHFQAVEINEKERKEIISLYLNLVDDDNYFFTQEDEQKLQKIASEKGLCDAFESSLIVYKKSLERYDSLTSNFYKKTIVLKKGENLTTNSSNNNHLRPSEKEFNKQLELSFKLDYLNSVSSKFSSDSTLEKKITSKLDEEIRNKLAQSEKKFISRKLSNSQEIESDLMNDFLNAIALRFDPHSGYFSTATKEAYEEELSSERLVYGIQFIENESFDIEVTALTPGSSAWNSNEILEGDILLELTDYKGVKHELNNKGMSYLSNILTNPEGKEASFKVKHKNGSISQVKLVKTKVENTDNSFTGYVLKDEINKFGYIALPSFYTDFEGDAQLGCANDVAKEILLLKKDSIQGLILDLRNNGGGSLKEAIELSGLFIDEGPMSIYQPKTEKPYLLKDMNRGTVYNGPLIVLVNSMSASASEFFAGCMQDYQRALIVGDRTYGKGTAQSIYPVSQNANNQDFVKVTNGKFYHVSSRSNQEQGIIPDISLEDVYSEIDYYLESNELYHLKNDSTSKKTIFKALAIKNKNTLIEKSKNRTSVSPTFTQIKKNAKSLAKRVQEDQKIPLDLESFLVYRAENEKFWDEVYKDELDNANTFEVKNHAFANKLLNLNESEQKFNQKIKEGIQKDILLHETFLILKDFFSLAQ